MSVFRHDVEFTTLSEKQSVDTQNAIYNALTCFFAAWHALCMKAGDAQPK